MNKLTTLTVQELQQLLVKKEISSQELCEAYYTQIGMVEPQVHAYITLTKALAEQTAKRIDSARMANEPLPALAGIPMAVKDNISVSGERMTCASATMQNYIAPYNATVIEKFRGCPILGKANLDEFAMGSATDTSYYGATYNPLDISRVPGGSSGGSAAAVAGHMAAFALGSDTGGSIRQPASFTGTVGLKPTYGSISRYGMAAFASSLDQIGPITKTVADAKLVFAALCGKDERDATSFVGQEEAQMPTKLRIGVPKEYMENLPDYTKAAVNKAIFFLQAKGHITKEIRLPSVACGPQTYAVLTSAEAYSNLARYDGIRFGGVKGEPSSYEAYRGQFGREVKRRVLFGGFVLRSENAAAYYAAANGLRSQICAEFKAAFETVDILLCPTAADEAFLAEEEFVSAQEAYLRDYFCVGASLAGVPALSMPMGKGQNGMPLGLQLIANHNQEPLLFSIGMLLEADCYGK